MNDLKRYDLDGEDAWTRESEKGDYVLADDHEAAIAEKDARISELEAHIEENIKLEPLPATRIDEILEEYGFITISKDKLTDLESANAGLVSFIKSLSIRELDSLNVIERTNVLMKFAKENV